MWYTNYFTYAALDTIDVDKIKRDLTIKIENRVHKKVFKPTIIKLYSFDDKLMFVPRFYPTNNTLMFNPIAVESDYIPTFISDNQRFVYEYLHTFYKEPAGCILKLRTGEGKSYIAKALGKAYGNNILITVHNTDMMMSWYKMMKIDYPGQVGCWCGMVKTKNKITIGVINSLIQLPKKWFDDFDFVIFDEITEYVSETRRALFTLATAPRLLGLSATPEQRGPHYQRIMELYCGPIINAANINGYSSEEIPWQVKLYPIKYYGADQYTERITNVLGYTSPVEMDKQFMLDNDRNKLIIDKINWMRELKKQVFVFVSLCEFAEILSQYFTPEEYHIMTGKIKRGLPSAPIIFTTYKYCSKGISIPRMDALILTQPRKSDIEQTVGRILRIGGNIQSERIIIDIIDMRTSLKNQYSERKKTYINAGFTMQKAEIINNI